jgi:chloride channel protein, CIC family
VHNEGDEEFLRRHHTSSMATPRNSLGRILDRLSPPEGLLLLVLSAIIGAVTGLAAVFFIRLIALISHKSYAAVGSLGFQAGPWCYIVVPVCGALLGGPLIAWFAREAKGHGVPEVMQALVQHGGRIRPRVALVKIFASALCIGTGGSAGREGPIVQVGSALGSSIGQVLHLSDERIRNLVACGAAAGIAATFNAPIAGVAFAIEVLMSELQVRMFGNIVISAVSASIVSQTFLGHNPAFNVPSHSLQSPVAILFYLVLGLAAALIGVGFIRMLGRFERAFDEWKFPAACKPAVGALLLGLVGFVYHFLPGVGLSASTDPANGFDLIANIPHVYGAGLEFIETALLGEVEIQLLLLLMVLKLFATSLTLGSGNSGGVFAPSLFIGAMLGGAMGKMFYSWWPELAGAPGAYALVGMAAVFAGSARAPLTAMLIVFEMSNDYSLILPLMVAAVTSCYLAQYLYADSIYTQRLSRRGIRFSHGRDIDIMQGVLIREVMQKDVVMVNKDDSLSDLYRCFQETNLLGFPVIDSDSLLWGVVTLQDMERIFSQDTLTLRGLTVDDVAVVDPITVFADEPIYTAIQKMAPRGLARLPVVSRSNDRVLLGMISRSDILRAYDLGIVRKQRGQMLEEHAVLRGEQYNGFSEIRLDSGQHAVGVLLTDLALPDSINVVSIERNGVLRVPHSNTSFLAGDIVTIFGRKESLAEAQQLFTETDDG